MQTIKLTLLVSLLCGMSLAHAERPPVNKFGYTTLYSTSIELKNHHFQYDFGSGQVFDIQFDQAGNLTWTILDQTKNSPGAPVSEVEQPDIYKLGDQTFMVVWAEKSGIIVTQHVDLKRSRVLASRAIPAVGQATAQAIIAQAKIKKLK